MDAIYPVILSGGSGTRLWPLSRSLYPKQFMDMGGPTLFAQALARGVGIAGAAAPLVVCNEEQRFLAAAELQAAGMHGRVLLEPAPRNTAPAVALAAHAALEEGGDPFLLVLPSDHKVAPQQAFSAAVARALPCAAQGFLLTFGIRPLGPESGFGYIRQGDALQEGAFRVARFVEKPNAAAAVAMLEEGGHWWNSGMFLFRASRYLEELARHAPDIDARCRAAWADRTSDMDFIRVDKAAFLETPAESVDYAVMERTERAAVLPLDLAWSDLGAWEAFYAIADKDADGNVLRGDVLALDVSNSYLHSSSRLVAALGVDNLLLVETPDALLVARRERAQDVKQIVEMLRRDTRPEKDTHTRVLRPWGSYESLVHGDRFQVKRIVVNPRARLSLQLHHHRAEHWVVVSGTAMVTVDEAQRMLHEDQSVYSPLGVRHSLENPGRIPLVVVEVQTGAYLGEDDIVRLEDNYGRARG